MINEVYSYFTENGNTGYHDLSISYEEDGVHKNFHLRTGVESEFQNFLLSDLDEILIGELTDKQYEQWRKFKNQPNYLEIVVAHDNQLIRELKTDLENKKSKFLSWLNSKEED